MNTRQAISKDMLDRQSFQAQFTPWDQPARQVEVQPVIRQDGIDSDRLLNGSLQLPPELVLDGNWEMAEGGEDQERLQGQWDNVIPVRVPGSIHQALVEAGVIGDPAFGENADIAKTYSHKTWWYRCTFTLDPDKVWRHPRLSFAGVSPACEVWLNGYPLGEHTGAFGGPEHDISALVEQENILIVKVHPAPLGNEWNIWHSTVVFNCNYGWHYVNLPAVGIWQSVRVHGEPDVSIQHPYMAALSEENAARGMMDLSLTLTARDGAGSGVLQGWIEPDNFAGQGITFSQRVSEEEMAAAGERKMHLQLQIPDHRMWWPLDMGEQHLYRLKLTFVPDYAADSPSTGRKDHAISAKEVLGDQRELTFGIRHVRMDPLPQGQQPDMYNWTFTVNGRPFFAKGTGWCTMDALMDFRREKYEHFLQLTAKQHVNFMRAWGGGMPETDDFYDICDRLGILIMQEWPTCWGSHAHQPYDALEETVIVNTLRLRNHPSLIMWGGGNETSSELEHESMQMMGRCSVELDGTRPFHRTDPLGGSTHDHIVWNGWTPAYSFDYYAGLDDIMLSEFGLASSPNMESVKRYLPEEERHVWPPEPGKSFYHHLPAFDTRDEMRILSEFADSFVPCDSLENFVTGTQMAQVVSLRHKMERARCHWPEQIGVVTYKLNDVYPGVSWATIDWYGVPKMSHYFTADAYAPLMVSVVFDKLNSPEQQQSLPVYLLDDREQLEGEWTAGVRVYNARLEVMLSESWQDGGSDGQVRRLGQLEMPGSQLEEAPLLVVAEIVQADNVLNRTFYWINFDARQGMLMNLPSAELELQIQKDQSDQRNHNVQIHQVNQPMPSNRADIQENVYEEAALAEIDHHSSIYGYSGRYPYPITVTNRGTYPAVAVELYQTEQSNRASQQLGQMEDIPFMAEDNFIWLDAGESRTIHVSSIRNIAVRAWNCRH
ncbi:glycoside hydrolase family 2 protein [Paenibacillus sp. Z6-24]